LYRCDHWHWYVSKNECVIEKMGWRVLFQEYQTARSMSSSTFSLHSIFVRHKLSLVQSCEAYARITHFSIWTAKIGLHIEFSGDVEEISLQIQWSHWYRVWILTDRLRVCQSHVPSRRQELTISSLQSMHSPDCFK
jgi:hypothetical protein